MGALHLYSAFVRVDALASLAAAVAPTSGALSALSDGDAATAATWSDARALDLVWDLGAGAEADVDGVRVGASGGSSGAFPLSFSMWFSDDNLNWTRQADWVGDYPGPLTSTPGYYGWTPIDYLTRMQLEFVGPDGSTSIVDDGSSVPWAASGGAQLKTNNFKWAPSALYLNGTSAYIATTAANGSLYTEQAFVFEMWFLIEERVNNWSTLIADARTTFAGSTQALVIYGDSNTSVPAANRGCLGWAQVGSLTRIVSPTPVTTGVWHKVKLMRVMADSTSGTFSLYLDDVLLGTYGLNGGNIDFGGGGTIIGRTNFTSVMPSAQSYFKGYIGEARFVRNISDTGYPPSLVRHPPPRRSTGALRVAEEPGRVPSLLGGWAFSGGLLQPEPYKTRDYSYGWIGKGIGRVRGKTLDYVPPANKPYRCRVRLVRDKDGQVVRSQWSEADGSYDFQYIDELETWSVWATYLDFGKRGEVSDGLTLANGKVELMA